MVDADAGQTDGRADGVQHLMWPHREGVLMARRTEPCWLMDTGSHYIIVRQSVSQPSQRADNSDGQEW